MLQVIDRYIIKETLQTWLAVTLVLMLILLSNRLARYLAEAVAGKIDGGLVFHLLALHAVGHLSLLTPMSLYVAFMLTFGRLYSDSEMSALGACGIGTGRLYRSMFWVSVPVTLLVVALTFVIGPWASQLGEKVRAQAEHTSDVSAVSPGRFRETMSHNGVFYVEKVHEKEGLVENVFVYLIRSGKPVMLSAQTATQITDPVSGDRYLQFKDGYRYEGTPGEEGYKVVQFEEHALLMQEKNPFQGKYKDRGSVPTLELLASSNPQYDAEWHWRLGTVLSVMVLTILALPLSKATPRQGRYGKVVVAILFYILYSNLLGVGRVWIEKGKVPGEVGLWWVHAILLIVAAFLLVRMHGLPWSKMVLGGKAKAALREARQRQKRASMTAFQSDTPSGS